MLDWIKTNMHWVFSGIGVLILGTIGRFLYGRYSTRLKADDDSTSRFPIFSNKSVKPQEYEVLPREYEVWLGQEIPHIDIWLYAVNYLSKEIIFDLCQITNFHFSGGPSIENISPNGEIRVPPKSSSNILCRRNLIDSEARALLKVERNKAVNASFSLICRAYKGTKKYARDYSQLSINGWVRGVFSS